MQNAIERLTHITFFNFRFVLQYTLTFPVLSGICDNRSIPGTRCTGRYLQRLPRHPQIPPPISNPSPLPPDHRQGNQLGVGHAGSRSRLARIDVACGPQLATSHPFATPTSHPMLPPLRSPSQQLADRRVRVLIVPIRNMEGFRVEFMYKHCQRSAEWILIIFSSDLL